MDIGSISPMQLLLILAIVLLVFGTKRLKSLGGDLGGAIKGFKKAMAEEDVKQESLANDSKDKVNSLSEKKTENEKSS